MVDNPWYFTYERMSKWLVPHMMDGSEKAEVGDHSGAVCSCCGTPAENWPTPNSGYQFIDSYKISQTVCEACATLYFTNVNYMGVERTAKGHPVAQRFGMLSSVVVIAHRNGCTMLVPTKIFNKLPKLFSMVSGIDLIEMTERRRVREYLLLSDFAYPVVLIDNLGRKKRELVGNLEFTYSPEQTAICNADKVTRFNKPQTLAALDILTTMPKKERTSTLKILGQITKGQISPGELSQSDLSYDNLELLQTCSRDPYERLYLIQAAKDRFSATREAS